MFQSTGTVGSPAQPPFQPNGLNRPAGYPPNPLGQPPANPAFPQPNGQPLDPAQLFQQRQQQLQQQGAVGQPPPGWVGQQPGQPGQAFGAAPFPNGMHNYANNPTATALIQQQFAQQQQQAQQQHQQQPNNPQSLPIAHPQHPQHQQWLQAQQHQAQNGQNLAFSGQPGMQQRSGMGPNGAPFPGQGGPPVAGIPPAIAALLASMTPEKLAAMTPVQQAQVKEMFMKQRMHQQQQLGLGFPGGPPQSSPAASGAPPPGQSPATNPQPGSTPAPPQPGQQPPAQPQPNPNQAQFLRTLGDFLAKRGIAFTGPPSIDGRQVDLQALYVIVTKMGGFGRVQTQGGWRMVLPHLGFAPDPSQPNGGQSDARVGALVQAYQQLLLPFETMIMQMQQARIQHQIQQQQQGAQPGQPGTPAQGSPAPPQTPQQVPPRPPTVNGAAPGPTQQQSPPAPAPNGLVGTPAFNGQQSIRPGTGSLAGTPAASTPVGAMGPPPPSAPTPQAEDRKGKGKAADQDQAKPAKLPSAQPSPAPSPFAAAAASASASATAVPATLPGALPMPPPIPLPVASIPPPMPMPLAMPPPPPPAPPRRKRQRIEYVPLSRSVETYASYQLERVEDVVEGVRARKHPRMAGDLGLVDLHSLTMALRSRLAGEVTFALNSLTLISLAMRTEAKEPGMVPFPLHQCGGLVDELFELMEEVAFGVQDEWDEEEEEQDEKNGAEGEEGGRRLRYRELFRLISQEEMELKRAPATREIVAKAAEGSCPLGGAETLLALTNVVRNVSQAGENASFLAQHPKAVEVLVKVATLPLKRDSPAGGNVGPASKADPLRVSAADAMVLRKDVIETLVNLALEVKLSEQTKATNRRLYELLEFFLAEADHQDQLYFDLTGAPSVVSKMAQPPAARNSHYLDLGLAAFARLAALDENRYVIADLATEDDLYALFETLIHLLPVTEADFQLVTSEPGLVFAENLCMSLYNLAFLAPTALKRRLRLVPGFVKALLRVVRRLAGTSADPKENPFVCLCDRCMAILQVLSDLEGVGVAGRAEAGEQPWFGLRMSGEETEAPSGPVPSEGDKGSVKAKGPRGVKRGKGVEGLGVLVGESRGLFEAFGVGSMLGAMGKLVKLADATGEKGA